MARHEQPASAADQFIVDRCIIVTPSADDRDQLAMPCKAIQLGPAGVLVDVFVETNVVGPHSATKRIRGHNGSAHQRLLPSTAHPVHGSIILSYIICDMNI